MSRLDPNMVCHALNIAARAKLVKHPKRNFHPEIEVQIKEKVKKLIAAGFIKPIKHPTWLCNIIPVKNKNRQIRIYVDFRDLNKAFSKVEFPLANINLLVDSTASHGMLSFMDGFSDYSQIKMSARDAEKTALRTPFGNFYYTVMPFGLKNTSATYQRAMMVIFPT